MAFPRRVHAVSTPSPCGAEVFANRRALSKLEFDYNTQKIPYFLTQLCLSRNSTRTVRIDRQRSPKNSLYEDQILKKVLVPFPFPRPSIRLASFPFFWTPTTRQCSTPDSRSNSIASYPTTNRKIHRVRMSQASFADLQNSAIWTSATARNAKLCGTNSDAKECSFPCPKDRSLPILATVSRVGDRSMTRSQPSTFSSETGSTKGYRTRSLEADLCKLSCSKGNSRSQKVAAIATKAG